MTPPLTGQSAIVTGGTRGIGRAIARKLLEAGAGVVICGRRQQDVDQAVAELGPNSAGQACDVSSSVEVARLFRFALGTWNRLDILVNNAGIGLFQPVDQISPEDWRRLLDTNLSGAFYCTREAVPVMRRQGGGYIFNIGSLAGKNPMAGGAAYNASKFGLLGFSEACMLDLRYDNIRVSCIMPGSVATDFSGPGRGSEDWKIGADEIAQTLLNLLALPARTLASRVEVRPTCPPRR
jgi:NAD(P)-dependent dehydrogenase (short-subunit alcohol dehydrogenase family)